MQQSFKVATVAATNFKLNLRRPAMADDAVDALDYGGTSDPASEGDEVPSTEGSPSHTERNRDPLMCDPPT